MNVWWYCGGRARRICRHELAGRLPRGCRHRLELGELRLGPLRAKRAHRIEHESLFVGVPARMAPNVCCAAGESVPWRMTGSCTAAADRTPPTAAQPANVVPRRSA